MTHANATRKTIPTPGGELPANAWGRATALMSLMYRDGLLPEMHAYGLSEEDPDYVPDMLYIGIGTGGFPAGRTDAEVTDYIWRLSAFWREHGYLWDDVMEAA